MANVSVIYYSSTGTQHALAKAVGEGAQAAGAEVRLRMVAETAPEAAIDTNPKWRAFADSMKSEPVATLDDLEWAEGVIIGTPTRYGNVAAQMKAFLDSTGGLWFQGKLADKICAGFTSAQNPHGGQESTLLALYHTFYHWGAIVAPPGYNDQTVFAAGGNPYGPSTTTGPDGDPPTHEDLEHARFLGRRVAGLADRFRVE